MKFCESYNALMEGPVKPWDNDMQALEELFPHPLTQQNSRWKTLTSEQILFDVSPEKWRDATGLSEQDRDQIASAVARDVYPFSLFIENYGWLLVLSPGTLRNFFFSRFKQYADRKLAIENQRKESRQQRLEAADPDSNRRRASRY